MGCPYGNENIISLYVEGHLSNDELKLFEEHLKSCDECMEKVINLKNDLLKIEIIGTVEDAFKDYVVFSVIRGVLNIMGGSGIHNYKRIPIPVNSVRGENENKGPVFQNVSIKDVDIKVYKDDGGISLELKAKNDIQYRLFNGERLIESSHISKEKKSFINILDRGSYRLIFIIPGEGIKRNVMFDFV